LITPTIHLINSADPGTGGLEEAAQAEQLIAAIRVCQRNFIDLDFSGVERVGPEFLDHFARLADARLTDVWLTPRHYEPACNRIVMYLLSRLKRQREQAWSEACETFAQASLPDSNPALAPQSAGFIHF